MKLIYFDNSATSHFKPRSVKKAFMKALNNSANAGRSGHKLSIINSMIIWKTREIIAKLYGDILPENVIFTKNCTEALNIAIQGLCNDKNKNVVCSCFEHNSVLRVLHELEKQDRLSLTIIYPENKKYITRADVEKNTSKNTFLVCVNSCSNVTGNKNDIEEIGLFCAENKLLFLVDDAQGAGHIRLDMKKNNINYLCFSGHKGYLSPQGIGALCINSKILPSPLMFGGTGSESNNVFQPKYPPESLESGTLQTPLIASLRKAILYNIKHFKKHNSKTTKLANYLFYELKKLKEVTIYSLPNNPTNVISFNINSIPSTQVCDYLDDNFNISLRGGLHCSPFAHKYLGTTENGIVRISLNFKNSMFEVKIFLKAIKKFISQNCIRTKK